MDKKNSPNIGHNKKTLLTIPSNTLILNHLMQEK